jgi:2-C-methyl-D-erythritol 4-phosphate cytidylyltransferase
MPNAAILLAAGRGERIQQVTADKVLTPLAGRPAFLYALEAFLRSGSVQHIVTVYRDDAQRNSLEEAIATLSISTSPAWRQQLSWVKGGKERPDSVLNGLRTLPENIRYVFIHDAARPLITPEAIQLLAGRVAQTGAATLARRVTDTIKQVRPASDLALAAFVLRTVDRANLWAMETPQAFDRTLLLNAYEKVRSTGSSITDDTAALENAGHPVALVEADFPNPKLTTPADVDYIEYLLKKAQ